MSDTSDILNEFKEMQDIFESFRGELARLIEKLFKNIKIQNISSRIKSIESLDKKITDKGKYEKLRDVTDLLGIRIITYYAKDVDKISSIIKKEFKIDEPNSIDKRIKEDDKFGYLSLHIIAELSEERTRLPEYKPYTGIKFEIQVRSILQHAWAEIEHDLGYKTAIEIPKYVKRRFYRLAGLLELADEEFENIYKDIVNYNKDINEKISKNNLCIEINRDTLLKFVQTSTDVEEIFKDMKDRLSAKISNDSFIGDRLEKLKFLQYTDIKQVNDDIVKYKDYIKNFSVQWVKFINKNNRARGAFSKDIVIFYLAFIKLLFEFSSAKQKEFISIFHPHMKNMLTDLHKIFDSVK